MNKTIFILVILWCLSIISIAQESVNSYTDFNFWIGDWNIQQEILDSDGSWIKLNASTSVESIMDGKAIIENWEGDVQYFWEGMKKPQKIKGYSIRYYNEKTDKWHIYWIDSREAELGSPFKGNFVRPGYGEFFNKTSPEGPDKFLRITFNQIDENTVEWTEAISKDGENWTDIWKMHMKRK